MYTVHPSESYRNTNLIICEKGKLRVYRIDKLSPPHDLPDKFLYDENDVFILVILNHVIIHFGMIFLNSF